MPDPVSTGSVASKGEDRRPLIVLDAGHGGIDPGAVASSGAFEKDIVFAFAQRLKARLEHTGRYRIAMTRDQDAFVALDERVRMARAAKADLFISIHANSISAAPHIRGSTVYTGAERATDVESERLAERENKADAVGGVEARETASEVADILQDLTMRETRGFSHRFTKRLLGALDPVMPLSKKPAPRGALPCAEGAGRAVGARRARLSVEPQGYRSIDLRGLARALGGGNDLGDRPLFRRARRRARSADFAVSAAGLAAVSP